MKLTFIEARRGCPCCTEDDHLRGPYRSPKEAQRRVDYFLSPEGAFHPLSSHVDGFARGNYQVVELDTHEAPDGQVLVANRLFQSSGPGFIFVGKDGRTADDGAEWFDDIL